MQAEVVPVLMPYIVKALVGLALTGIGALLVWPFKKVRKEYISLKQAINNTQAELIMQRTNCLQTLQNQGDKQIELLGEVAGTLSSIHLDQKEQMGYIKASMKNQ